MKWWDRMPWSSFSECWALSHFFTLHFHLHQEAFEFLFTFCHKGGVICISEVIDISPGNLDSSLCSFQSSSAFLMMYSAYKLNKQGDNIQPWRPPFPIWNQSVFHVQFSLLLPDLHTGLSRSRSGGLVFPSLSEFSTVYCDPHFL